MDLAHEIKSILETAIEPYGYEVVGSSGTAEGVDEVYFILDCERYDYPKVVAVRSAVETIFPGMMYGGKRIIVEYDGLWLD
ncbi:MAG: hypothetical protein G01um101448_232 [Parcubacteria group bacterium Gr01-1014_48]|nr:MAG: hypothetical protein G01um101448_232 [Parcubacteria group bacterium Gr01-1014_48]